MTRQGLRRLAVASTLQTGSPERWASTKRPGTDELDTEN